jgi:hypothetical protein
MLEIGELNKSVNVSVDGMLKIITILSMNGSDY